MDHTEKLCDNLYGVPLYVGKIQKNPTHGMFCFFLVKHSTEPLQMEKEIRQLLVAGCRSFVFYGQSSKAWRTALDVETGLQNISEFCAKECADADSFLADILYKLKERPFVPCDIYLIYDDRDEYEVLARKLRN